MKEEKLFRSIGHIEDTFINEAEDERPSMLHFEQKHKLRHEWKRYGLAAASILLVVMLGRGLLAIHAPGGKDTSSGSAAPDTADKGMNEYGTTSGSSEENIGCIEVIPSYKSYAGPVLPMALLGKLDKITISRDMVFDFSSAEDTTDTDSKAMVTDRYTVTNSSAEKRNFTVAYPFVYHPEASQEQIPVLSLDGRRIESTISISQERTENLEDLTSWDDYRSLWEDTVLKLEPKETSQSKETMLLYQETELTIPAGESIVIVATYQKEASYNYDEDSIEAKSVYAYDLVTNMENSCYITAQTVEIHLPEKYEITDQNFGFRLLNNNGKVELENSMEYYYLEMKEKN